MKRIKLAAYLQERFPPVNAMLFAILFGAVYSVSTKGATPGWTELWGIAAVVSFFFRLRVMDEIKDYQIDLINHPNRILQSGGVTLPVLIGISFFGSAIEAGWSLYSGMNCTTAWFVALAYSFLMRYEFFIGAWLRPRLLIYSISHMLVMPAIIAWIWFGYRNDFSPELGLLMILSITAGFCFELARKTHAPEGERRGIDSYSKSLGLRRSVLAICLLLAVGLGFLFYLFYYLKLHTYAYALLGLIFFVVVFFYSKGLKSKKDAHFRKGEKAVSLYMLLSYLVLIIEMLR
ncbi:MAG: UbiA family prenyltransferase [Flavobacteriales bacterium]|nr:UbiA family prenyltransferase [Flavobacteriales bacterium]